MKHGKNYIESKKLIDSTKQYDVREGLEAVLETAKCKFDETIEVSIRLGVDSRHADQQVRGAIVLPHGTGKTVRVLVFAKADKAREAQEAGADFVGDEDMGMGHRTTQAGCDTTTVVIIIGSDNACLGRGIGVVETRTGKDLTELQHVSMRQGRSPTLHEIETVGKGRKTLLVERE